MAFSKSFLGLLALSSFAAPSPTHWLPYRRFQSPNTFDTPLTFNQKGEFQISIFEDLHLGEDQSPGTQDQASIAVMDSVLSNESPDFVVLNGDLMTGEVVSSSQAGKACLDKIVGPLLQRNLTWGSAYGNHDHGIKISTDELLQRESRWPNSRTRNMVQGQDAGTSNYYLPVYAPTCHNPSCEPELILWFFDSRGGYLHGKAQPEWVDKSVVDWFQQTAGDINQKYHRVIPSIAFVHIPLHASGAIQKTKGRFEINAEHHPGINGEAVTPQGRKPYTYSTCNTKRPPAGEREDEPFQTAIATTPGLIGLFSGHDHANTWCYKWNMPIEGISGNGVNLCYGQHSGYGGYGDWIRGARQILVSKDTLRTSQEAKTWIRLEDGDVVGSVTLNSTYGQDVYPVSPDKKTSIWDKKFGF